MDKKVIWGKISSVSLCNWQTLLRVDIYNSLRTSAIENILALRKHQVYCVGKFKKICETQ